MTLPSGVWRTRLRWSAISVLAMALAASPWWGPRMLSRMSFFQMQRVEVHGLTFLAESELLRTLAVDTTMSIWIDLKPLQERLDGHPQLLSAELSRRLPGTLVVRVKEKEPVALAPGDSGLIALDATGAVLPVDPARDNIDVPIIGDRGDTALVILLSSVKASHPALFRRISGVTRLAGGEYRIDMLTFRVLAMANVTVDRLTDILPVERDLIAKSQPFAELDLRFDGQVIARLK